jgi:hypothetical protein
VEFNSTQSLPVVDDNVDAEEMLEVLLLTGIKIVIVGTSRKRPVKVAAILIPTRLTEKENGLSSPFGNGQECPFNRFRQRLPTREPYEKERFQFLIF